MGELTIGDVAQQVGLNTSAVRYYESVGLLPAPKRVNGRRRYDSSAVQMLSMILFAQKAGFTLTEIKTLFHGFSTNTPAGERWRLLAGQKLAEIDALIQRAEQMRKLIEVGMQCGCIQWQDCRLFDETQACEQIAEVTAYNEV
jgi:MerR family transcriptional regulator, redox-sensitive transcriptional activator SoxR